MPSLNKSEQTKETFSLLSPRILLLKKEKKNENLLLSNNWNFNQTNAKQKLQFIDFTGIKMQSVPPVKHF